MDLTFCGVIAGAGLRLLGRAPEPAAKNPQAELPRPRRAENLGAVLRDEAEIQPGSCWEGEGWPGIGAGCCDVGRNLS